MTCLNTLPEKEYEPISFKSYGNFIVFNDLQLPKTNVPEILFKEFGRIIVSREWQSAKLLPSRFVIPSGISNEVIDMQFAKVPVPNVVKLFGSDTEDRVLQLAKALLPDIVTEKIITL